MGLSCTTLQDLENNEYLVRFCGTDKLSPNDPIWNKLFSHSLQPVFTKDDGFLFDNAVDTLKSCLISNNVKTNNISALINVFTVRALELKSSVQTFDSIFLWQAHNALFMIRQIFKYLVEFLNEQGFYLQFKVEQNDHTSNTSSEKDVDSPKEQSISDASDVLESLLDSLVRIIIEIPISTSTYVLHWEAVNTILVLLSTQMYWSGPAESIQPFRIMMEGSPSTLAAVLMKALLRNYVDHRSPPFNTWHTDDSRGLVVGITHGLWSILRQGVGLGKPKDVMDGLREHNLASHSLYLFLVLVYHCTGGKCRNPYRDAISFENDSDTDGSVEGGQIGFTFKYSKLYNCFCKQIIYDDSTLLMYMLIHRNISFKSYIMARSDVESLVLPILTTLYNAPTSTSHHIYMSLIVLLILSEDELFNQQVHDIMLKNITWYTEKTVTDISLGGLIILVAIRTIQYNILKMRDKYLHTNCLAALANMSSKFRSLHPYVAQRLISLFETLGKRHTKLLERLQSDVRQNQNGRNSEIIQEIGILEEVIRMVLEILNSVVTHQLAQNRHLIYSLLYKRNIFDPFRDYSATGDLMYNLDIVINYFGKRLTEGYHQDLGVSEVMERIVEGTLHWTSDILRKFPDLKFRYVEEEQPDDFFIPYVWSIVYRSSGVYWSPLNVLLFDSQSEYLV